MSMFQLWTANIFKSLRESNFLDLRPTLQLNFTKFTKKYLVFEWKYNLTYPSLWHILQCLFVYTSYTMNTCNMPSSEFCIPFQTSTRFNPSCKPINTFMQSVLGIRVIQNKCTLFNIHCESNPEEAVPLLLYLAALCFYKQYII